MSADWDVTLDVEAAPEAAWAVVGDPCGVTRWYALYTSCRTEGNTRTLERADGAVVVEDILTRDDAAMHYSYTVTAGLPLAEHEASFSVEARGSGSRIIWHTHAVSDHPSVDMEARLADRQREALEGLRALLDG
jgi:hypothetical protein